MSPGERDFLLTHVGFTLVAALAVLAPLGPLGVRLTAVVLVYAVGMVAFTRTRRPEWWPALRFVMALSAFQVLPDWFLSRVLGVLVFADTGGPRIDTVPAFMAGLWTVPFFGSVMAGRLWAARAGRGPFSALAVSVSVAVGLTLFLVSEATLWALPMWEATGVMTVLHVAVYVVPAEALLCWAVVAGVDSTKDSGPVRTAGVAVLVALLYTGALAVSFLLLERSPLTSGSAMRGAAAWANR